MRTEILLNDNRLFHKGEIEVKKLVNKAPVYNQSKTEIKLIGPAAYKYFDVPNPYVCNCEYKDDVWEYVQLPLM